VNSKLAVSSAVFGGVSHQTMLLNSHIVVVVFKSCQLLMLCWLGWFVVVGCCVVLVFLVFVGFGVDGCLVFCWVFDVYSNDMII
jgi:hypothetical protein